MADDKPEILWASPPCTHRSDGPPPRRLTPDERRRLEDLAKSIDVEAPGPDLASIVEDYAKAALLAATLEKKIDADVAEAIRQKRQHLPSLPPSPEEEPRLRGKHPELTAWAHAAQDAADAAMVLEAVWPVAVRHHRHPTTIHATGGEVRLLLRDGHRPEVRWVPGLSRRSRPFCLQCDTWASLGCRDDCHDTLQVVACSECENDPRQCAACKETQG